MKEKKGAAALLRLLGIGRQASGSGANHPLAVASEEPMPTGASSLAHESWTTGWGDSTEDLQRTLPQLASTGGYGPAPLGVHKEGQHRSGSSDVAGASAPRYRILGMLGRGGMGVVYRAEDTRLGRVVALKILLRARVSSRRAQARCFAEAHAASALDHPNLCTIHEIAEMPDGQPCIVMACYDGETLKSRLQRGPLPALAAIEIARQVARGLAKAHARGIVHCDIKPANLMLTTDGLVKILDFGIARLADEAAAGFSRVGMGTPGYMSPEQAAGGTVGPASDVWSLGAVLVEMLGGRPSGAAWDEAPPAGSHISALLASLEAPADLRPILSRMLAASTADRYHDAAELLVDLEPVAVDHFGSASARRTISLRQFLAALATVVAAVSAFRFLAWKEPHSAGRSHEAGEALAARFSRLTSLPGPEWYPSISPDGGVVLWVKSVAGRSHIFRQLIGDGSTRDLSGASPADDTQPAFSPDGNQIAFRSERNGGGIFVMDAMGSSVRQVTSFGFNPSWSHDGQSILYATEGIVDPHGRMTESRLLRVDLATGISRTMSNGDAVQPRESPHGLRIAYWGVFHATGERVIWTIPADGGAAVPAVRAGGVDWNPIWSPDGRYLYFVSDRTGVANLWRVRIEEATGQVLGEPVPVTNSSQPAMFPSISRDGTRVVYSTAEAWTRLERGGFDALHGKVTAGWSTIAEIASEIRSLDASPDGRSVTYQVDFPREALLVANADGASTRRLVDDWSKNRDPRWSPDGSRIAFYSNRGGKYDIWTIRSDGSGLEAETSIPGPPVDYPVWSPDSKRMAIGVGNQGGVIDLAQPFAERRVRFLPAPAEGGRFSANSWSADGEWLAGAVLRADGYRYPGIVLLSLRRAAYLRLTDRGSSPRWLRTGRRLLYLDGNNLSLIDVETRISRLVLGSPPGSDLDDFGLSWDETTLYVAWERDEGDIWMLVMHPAEAGTGS